MMKAVSPSETSVNFYQTRRRNIPEDGHLVRQSCVRYEVLTAMKMQIVVLRAVMSCGLTGACQSFGGISRTNPEDRVDKFLRNVVRHIKITWLHNTEYHTPQQKILVLPIVYENLIVHTLGFL
jgi:hypothetical protein